MVCVLGFVDTLCKCVCSYKYFMFTKTLQHTCGMRMNTLNARYVYAYTNIVHYLCKMTPLWDDVRITLCVSQRFHCICCAIVYQCHGCEV